MVSDETTEGEPLTPEVIESIEHPEAPTVVEDIEDHAIDGEIVQIGETLF